jgi:uncharacterized protein YwgA
VVLHLNDDLVEGKTVLQKLAYFTSQIAEVDVDFEPYFYGPFSRGVEQAVELLELSGEVEQTVTSLGVANTGWPIARTTYRLTDIGTKTVEEDLAQHEELAEAAQFVLENVKAQDQLLNQKPLSVAAKVHYLLSHLGEPMTNSQVAAYAKGLGWELSDWDIQKADDLLESLGMIENA